MSAGWIAGTVRARLLLQRRLGPDGARALASCGSLAEALEQLEGTTYDGPVRDASDLEDAQHAVAAQTLLWLRVLTAWLPRGALGGIRALGAWFELVNVENRLAYLRGSQLRPAFETGSLSTSWPRIGLAQSPRELREALRASPWGDPGGEEPVDVHLGLRLAWARRVLASVPEAGPWAAGAVALLLARETTEAGGLHRASRLAAPALGGRGPREGALTIASLRAELPQSSSWSLAGVEEPEDLWRAEAAWWRAVGADAHALVRGPLGSRGVLVGVIALLGLDAARIVAALGVAALDGAPQAREALDALL